MGEKMVKNYLALNPFGLFILDENGEIKDMVDWSKKDVVELAKILHEIEEGQLPGELLNYLSEKRDQFDTLVLEDEDLARAISSKTRISVEVEVGDKVFRRFRKNIVTILQDKLSITPKEYYSKLREVTLELARRKVRKAAEKRDLFIAQAINALDDINKTINLLASRVREWYGLHFPELGDLVDEHEDYMLIVSKIGMRENFTVDKLLKLGIEKDLAERIIRAAKESMGADLAQFDLDAIKLVSDIGLQLYDARRKLEKYIDEAMLEVAPNIRGLVGSLLGARLISLAGGLKKLATLPASTIQVLGAEKALFRALRYGAKPPKHGVIFQYPAIHRSPRWQRGKIARALAAKLAIAARIDAFTGEYRADELKEELEKRIQEIKTLYAKPPVRKTEKKERRREKRGKKKFRRHRRKK